MRVPVRFAAALGCAVVLASCATVTRNTSRTFNTVVVDAGHGGRDSGAYRRYGPAEKYIALDVARRLDRKLRESQLKTVMTRSSDTFIPLDGRVAIAGAQPNSIFVSIHFNDSGKKRIHGFETYYYSSYAYGLAAQIERNLSTIRRSSDRGVHTANFRVLRNAVYPAVLVECGFLSNKTEGRETGSPAYRELLADKIAEAIVDYRYGEGTYRRAPSPDPSAEQATRGPLIQ
jgi:N-acetylmuramoyl-L-alanine amidase